MAEVVNAALTRKGPSEPNALYESMKLLWCRSRAVCSGERFVKAYDTIIDNVRFTNMLLPFSTSMDQKQYDFYRAEAELPGIVAQYARIIVGGLLRKRPVLELPAAFAPDVKDWILNEFGQDESPLVSFLDSALWEELQTSRVWIYVDYPKISTPESMTREDYQKVKPYPVIWKAENVINWRYSETPKGKRQLVLVVCRTYEEEIGGDPFHPALVETIVAHQLVNGYYQITIWQRDTAATSVPVVNAKIQTDFSGGQTQGGLNAVGMHGFKEISVNTNIMMNGARLEMIPAWPLNGSQEPPEPALTQLVDREISLYNKISRRNHLLYGAATYTPVIASNMIDSDFEEIVNGGLGSWIKINQGDTATCLATPTEALADMDRAIVAVIEEMAKLGVRMLSPETAQSGVALDIRNASQTAQLGSMNQRISHTLRQVICFMINWRYNVEISPKDINFLMSADFNATPLGNDWVRLATEWYQAGLIPRSVWLTLLKQNDLVDSDYDDKAGQAEIAADPLVMSLPAEQQLQAEAAALAAEDNGLPKGK